MFKRLGDARDAMVKHNLNPSLIMYDKSMECDVFSIICNKDDLIVYFDEDKECVCWLSASSGLDFEFTTMESFIESVNYPPFTP